MGLIDRVKAVWKRMIGQDQISKLFDIADVTWSNKMEDALRLYADMRSGVPRWCKDDVRTIRFSNTICRELATLITFNTSVEVTGSDLLQAKVDEVMNILQQKQEECCATCGMMVKSNGTGIEFLTPENFIITEHDISGNALAAVFFSWIMKNDMYYVRCEYHRFEGRGDDRRYHISTKAYATKNLDVMGDEISLSQVAEWADIEPEVEISNLEHPLFVYWRTPYANTIDPESPLCVPAFSEAIEELKDLDIAYSRNAKEIEDSERIVLADDRLMMPSGAPVRNTSAFSRRARKPDVELPHYVKNVFGTEASDFYQEINPSLNTDMRLTGINNIISQIGYKCGFSNGYFTFNQKTGTIATATQVESDDRRTLQTIQAFRNVLDGKHHDGVIHRIIYILYVIAVSNGEMPATNYEVKCDFADLTNNPDEDRARWWQYVLQGKVPAWKYFEKFEMMTEEEAKALTEEAEPQEMAGLFAEE